MSSKRSSHVDARAAGRGGRAASAALAEPRVGSATSKAARGRVPKKEERWTEMASFVINFERRAGARGSAERRITAHKMQDGGITAQWSGLAQEPLIQWIAEHVNDWGDMESVQPVAAAEAALPLIAGAAAHCDTASVNLSISAVEAHQAGRTGAGGRGQTPDPGRTVALKSSAAFDLDAVVRISGPDGRELPSASTPCTVQFFVSNVATKEQSRLGEVRAGATAPGASSAAATLPRITLPAGTYRVASVAILKGTPPKLAYAQGPLLEVA